MKKGKGLLWNQSGEVNYVTVFLILMLLGIGFASVVFAPAWYKNYTLAHYAKGQAVKARVQSDFEIRDNILQEAQRMGIEYIDLNVSRHNETVTVDYSFEVPYPFSEKTFTLSTNFDKEYGEVLSLQDDSKKKKFK